ncbi:unnamed protein product [Sphacelaria rigidula]
MTPINRREMSMRYLVNNILVLIQLILLLALFLKPLVVSGLVHNRSTMESYRRIFVRNVVCTVVIMIVLVATTIVGFTVFSSAKETPNTRHALDMCFMLHALLTLYITEITIPFGCSSCCKACSEVRRSKRGTSLNHAGHVLPGVAVAPADPTELVLPSGISTTSTTV